MNLNERKRSLLNAFNFPAKKFKKSEVSDEELSDLDLQIDLDSSSYVDNTCQINSNVNISWTRPISSDYIKISTSTGDPCYIKMSQTYFNDDFIKPPPSNHLATQDYYKLLDEAEEILLRKRDYKNNLVETHNSQLTTLWVTKYSPKHYIDLLSPEFANVNLLSWMKCWDKHVFKRSTKFIEKIKSKATEGQNTDDFLQLNPKDGMPIRKVVLLSGPPGLGKTTMAQIIAKHCGYSTVEINASVDRSAESFRMNIVDLAETKKFAFDETLMKPKCLILDEVDGAPASAISVLINAINTSNKMDKSTTTKKKGNILKITRPIICICNDLYSPSLRQLRPLCFVIKITPPDYHILIERLSDICRMEKLECDRSVLTNIIDSSNRDIRSCLNTLQFLKSQGIQGVTNECMSSLKIGQKDNELDSFKIWQSIFFEPNLKNHFISHSENINQLSLRSHNILKIAHSSGDIDKIISGIQENYLSIVRFRDTHLREMVQAADWMAFNDLANNQIHSKQIYEMFKYKQFLVPFFHLTFASTANAAESIKWPMSDFQGHMNFKKSKAIYDAFVNNQASPHPWILSRQDLWKTIIPNIINIVQPMRLRPINSQLFTSSEKITLKKTVDLMISNGLHYEQEKVADLQYRYVLYPNIEEFVQFNLCDPTRKQLTYAIKQLIANEVNREKIRKLSVNTTDVLNEHSLNRIEYIMQKEKEMRQKSTLVAPSKRNSVAAFSFVTGSKKSKPTVEAIPNSIGKILNHCVWFKHKEGCSNAIKRLVKLKDL